VSDTPSFVPVLLYAAIVVLFVVAGVLFVRSTQKGAFVDRLPVEDDEDVLLEEEGLRLFHRSRRRAVRGGGTTTYRVRSVLTNRRILLATGGPEGTHRFVILMIVDYTTPAPPVPEHGYAAYRRKFRLDNGYPTYACTAADVDVEDGALRIVVPFPEGGRSWGDPPEVKLWTARAARYRDAVTSP
jgi:hypothetical protein